MEEKRRIRLGAAALLTLSSAAGFFALKLLGMVCWVLPVIGLLLPLLALPVLWGGAAMLAAGGIVLCAMELRGGGAPRRGAYLLLIGVNAAVLAGIVLVTAYLFGLIPRSWAWLWRPVSKLGSWFFHMPSAFALM